LVRGMDYYNLTVFEFVTDRLGSQGTICGGGRYDYLVEQVGGKPAPAVGWALGVERVLELVREEGGGPPPLAPDMYAVVQNQSAWPFAMKTIELLRAAGASVQMHGASGDGIGSMKAQFKKADGSGARFALVFGLEEVARESVTVKPLRESGGEQVTHSITSLLSWAQTLQSNA